VGDPERRRTWLPFLIGLVGATAALLLAAPLGGGLGLPDDDTGYFALVVYAAIPISLVAAVAARSWVGAVTMALGFGVAGAAAGVFEGVSSSGDAVTDAIRSALIVALPMSAAGVPTYLMAVGGLRLVARSRAATETAAAVEAAESTGAGSSEAGQSPGPEA
jgi:hypothetical protein